MTQPVDLTRMFGEGWCVTLTRLPSEDALRAMGVDDPAPVPDGLDRATRRLTTPDAATGSAVLLLAKPASPGWTAVLELEGTTGWVGMDPDVLTELVVDGAVACSAVKDPNRVAVLFAEDGGTFSGLDAVTGRRWGLPGERLAAALTAAGFHADQDCEPVGKTGALTSSQAAVLALETATGAPLSATLTDDTPWTAGLAP